MDKKIKKQRLITYYPSLDDILSIESSGILLSIDSIIDKDYLTEVILNLPSTKTASFKLKDNRFYFNIEDLIISFKDDDTNDDGDVKVQQKNNKMQYKSLDEIYNQLFYYFPLVFFHGQIPLKVSIEGNDNGYKLFCGSHLKLETIASLLQTFPVRSLTIAVHCNIKGKEQIIIYISFILQLPPPHYQIPLPVVD